MGVIVETAEPYRRCNSCNSDDGVIEITVLRRVGKAQQGIEIALCESCTQRLRFALNSRYGGHGERDE